MGTVEELGKIAERVLVWVAEQRASDAADGMTILEAREYYEELRRVELCALAVQDQTLLLKWLSP